MKRSRTPRRAKSRQTVRYEEIAADFQQYLASGSSAGAGGPWIDRTASAYDLAHLGRFFRRRPVPEINQLIAEYVLGRERERATPATINGELRALAAMHQLAVKNGKLREAEFPQIDLVREEAAHTPSAPSERPWFVRAWEAQAIERARREASDDDDKPIIRHQGADEKSRKRGTSKLSDEGCHEHLARHPWGKRWPDSSHFSATDRAKALEREQGIKIHRTTVIRRLKKAAPPPP